MHFIWANLTVEFSIRLLRCSNWALSFITNTDAELNSFPGNPESRTNVFKAIGTESSPHESLKIFVYSEKLSWYPCPTFACTKNYHPFCLRQIFRKQFYGNSAKPQNFIISYWMFSALRAAPNLAYQACISGKGYMNLFSWKQLPHLVKLLLYHSSFYEMFSKTVAMVYSSLKCIGASEFIEVRVISNIQKTDNL